MITGTQVKMARTGLGWGVRDLAAKADITANTVTRFENGGGIHLNTAKAIQDALEAAGTEFLDPDNGGPGVRLQEPQA